MKGWRRPLVDQGLEKVIAEAEAAQVVNACRSRWAPSHPHYGLIVAVLSALGEKELTQT